MSLHIILVVAFWVWGVFGIIHHSIHGYEGDIHHVDRLLVYYFLLGPIMWSLKVFEGMIFLTFVTIHYVENWNTFIKFKNWLFRP